MMCFTKLRVYKTSYIHRAKEEKKIKPDIPWVNCCTYYCGWEFGTVWDIG